MTCPKCGAEMVSGEINTARGDSWIYWAPKAFFDAHWLNPYQHTRRTIEREGGLAVKTNGRIQTPSTAYACAACKLIMIDCHDPSC